MALYRSVWYDTDYESEEEPIKVSSDPYSLFNQDNFSKFYYEHRLDSYIIKKSSYYNFLKKKSEPAFTHFVALESNYVALRRALKLSRAARYQFRRFIEVTYGHPTQETSPSRDQAQQRLSCSPPPDGATRDNPLRGTGNNDQDSATSPCRPNQGEDDDGGSTAAN